MRGVGMPEITESDFKAALRSQDGANSQELLRNPKLYKATFDILKEVEKSMRAGASVKTATGLASGAASLANAVGGSRLSPDTGMAVRATSFMASEINVTMGLVNATRLTSVGAVIALAGSAVVQKTGLAVSLAGGDKERAKCVGALMELAGSAGVTIATLPVASMTVVGAVLTTASTAASAWNAYNVCRPLAD